MLTGPWTLDDTWFSRVFYAFTVLENGRKCIAFDVKLSENNVLILENNSKQQNTNRFPIF